MKYSDFMVSDILKGVFEQEVSKKIDEEIDKKVVQFKEELLSKKEEYIAVLMKSIRIYSDQNTMNGCPRYQIVFENTYGKEEK